MAIVEMKKLTLLALKRDREKLMRQLQKLGCENQAKSPIRRT